MEIELKFTLSPQDIERAESAIVESPYVVESSPTLTLSNAYYDTEDNQLRSWDFGLRTRTSVSEDGSVSAEQTIKLAGQDVAGLQQRPEYNVDIQLSESSAAFANLSLFDKEIWPEGFDVDDIDKNLVKVFETTFVRKVWNITLNNRIREEFKKEVFVGPNPSDCGIATGHILRYLKPKNSIDVTYKGIPILDKPLLGEYSNGIQFVKKIMKEDEEYHYYEQTELETVIDDLVGGKIIGVVQGNSEHGPRALGNRSIICNPSLKDMKDILNAKVKNREWYRPFAPIVRLEDVSKYFEFEGESRWMTFSPKVKNDWRDKLPAITHVDGSSRVQTVTEEQNPFMYKLLTEMDKKTGVGMLVNTSFNVNGKPILSTYRDAFEIFNKTDMDGLIIENIYIKK